MGLTFGIKELDWSCDQKWKVTLVVSVSAGFVEFYLLFLLCEYDQYGEVYKVC